MDRLGRTRLWLFDQGKGLAAKGDVDPLGLGRAQPPRGNGKPSVGIEESEAVAYVERVHVVPEDLDDAGIDQRFHPPVGWAPTRLDPLDLGQDRQRAMGEDPLERQRSGG